MDKQGMTRTTDSKRMWEGSNGQPEQMSPHKGKLQTFSELVMIEHNGLVSGTAKLFKLVTFN